MNFLKQTDGVDLAVQSDTGPWTSQDSGTPGGKGMIHHHLHAGATNIQTGKASKAVMAYIVAYYTQYTVHSTQYTVHSTQYTVHSTQYTVHSTQYTVHSTQYTVHSTQYTVHSTQYTVHSTQYTVHSTQYTVHSTQYTVHSTQYTVHSTQYTVHSTQYTVHSTQYTVHSTQYTVHSTQYTVHSTQYTVHSTHDIRAVHFFSRDFFLAVIFSRENAIFGTFQPIQTRGDLSQSNLWSFSPCDRNREQQKKSIPPSSSPRFLRGSSVGSPYPLNHTIVAFFFFFFENFFTIPF